MKMDTTGISSRRILVIEDEDDLREILTTYLEMKGFQVEAARDGVEALEMLDRDSGYNLILLDLLMPRMGGRQFRSVQRDHPILSQIPVVVVTADWHVEPDLANAIVKKPYEFEALLRLVYLHSRPASSRGLPLVPGELALSCDLGASQRVIPEI